MRTKKNLTMRQEAFVQNLLLGDSQRKAYRKAYPTSEKWADHVVDVRACELLKDSKVRVRFDELRNRVVEKAAKKAVMSAADVLAEVSVIGEANIADYLKVECVDIVTGYKTGENGEPDKSQPIIRNVQVVRVFDTDTIPREKLAAVSSIKQGRNGIEIRLHDKTKALELLGKHHKVFEDTQKIEHSGSINVVFNIPRPPKQQAKEEPPAEDVTEDDE